MSLVTTVLATSSRAATDYSAGVGRIRSCIVGDVTIEGSDNVTIEGLDFNPTSGGKDVEFVMSNPVCTTVVATSYAAVKGAVFVMDEACGINSQIRITPSPLMDAADLLQGIYKCASSRNLSCCGAVTAAAASLGPAMAALGVIYGIAVGAYSQTKICGADWMYPNADTYDFSTPGYKQTVQNKVNGFIRNKLTACLSLDDNSNCNPGDGTNGNKTYREWYYGGVETEDNPADGTRSCYDVTKPKPYPKQKYYLKGTDSGNYNCKKYFYAPGSSLPNSGATAEEMNEAYSCCITRSQQYICIDYNYSTNPDTSVQKFCASGSNCILSDDGMDITFSTQSLDSGRMICAQTYSLCPYNFSVGGGTEYCDYYRDGYWNSDQGQWIMITAEQLQSGNCSANGGDTCTTNCGSEIRKSDCTYNNKAGKCKNYCQYLTHCTKTSDIPYISTSELGPYFSDACINFEGDSQNNTSFTGQKHFSAPIAQCIKETLENVFYNRAGHSECADSNEYPQPGGICSSGLYETNVNFVYKKGNMVKDTSFFTIIQDNIQLAVKMVLTLSIMFLGMNVLLSKANLSDRKTLIIYVLKIGLVLYFATGDAWQSVFFNGIYNGSAEFAKIVFKMSTPEDESLRDGCQFGQLSLPDGSQISSGLTYPDGKEYLAMWDTLDCKIMRYLGFGPEASAANITMLVLAGYFTGSIGVYFALSTMIFGLMLISATIRALHIFLASYLSIIIFVFVSPIIIPLVLFTRTKSIFDNWLKELISFCLQPMILFAYIAIFITIMDQTLIGSASFSGQAPVKTLNCQPRCVVEATGETVPYNGDQAPACDQQGQVVIDPLDDSVACLLNFNGFGKFPGLEIIGISIPIIVNLFSTNVKVRILTILKGALVMYLLYKFMDEIPGITSALIGGTKLPTNSMDAFSAFNTMAGVTRAIQKRLGRAAFNVGKKTGQEIGGTIRDRMQGIGDKGKEIKDPTSGSDNVGDSGGGSGGGKGSDHGGGSGEGKRPDNVGDSGRGGSDQAK